jgi:hypothetical protein
MARCGEEEALPEVSEIPVVLQTLPGRSSEEHTA